MEEELERGVWAGERGALQHRRTPHSQVTRSEDVGAHCLGDGGGSRAVTPGAGEVGARPAKARQGHQGEGTELIEKEPRACPGAALVPAHVWVFPPAALGVSEGGSSN